MYSHPTDQQSLQLSAIIAHTELCDSKSAVRKVFKMRELKHNGIVKVIHVPTSENAADIFTKVLDTPTFQRHLHTIYNSAARPRGG